MAIDAAPSLRGAPLVLISHGNGGTPWSHRHTASHLVRAGFVVVLVEHIGNSRSDNTLAGTLTNLQNRPRHLQLALDGVLGETPLAGALDPQRVGALGHSIGPYTVLSAAGARAGAADPITPPPHVQALVANARWWPMRAATMPP